MGANQSRIRAGQHPDNSQQFSCKSGAQLQRKIQLLEELCTYNEPARRAELLQQLAGTRADQDTFQHGSVLTLRPPEFHPGRLIAAGSYGRVYAGTYDGQPAALKLLLLDEGTAHAILNEVRLCLKLNHKNLVQLLDCAVVATNNHAAESLYMQAPSSSATCADQSEVLPVFGSSSNLPCSGTAQQYNYMPVVSSQALPSIVLPCAPPTLDSQDAVAHDLDSSANCNLSSAAAIEVVQGAQSSPMHSFGHACFEVWIAMELCDGGTLAEQLQRGFHCLPHSNQLDMEQVLHVVLDIAHALVYMHHESVCHGDLKTENVLLKTLPDGSATDFQRSCPLCRADSSCNEDNTLVAWFCNSSSTSHTCCSRCCRSCSGDSCWSCCSRGPVSGQGSSSSPDICSTSSSNASGANVERRSRSGFMGSHILSGFCCMGSSSSCVTSSDAWESDEAWTCGCWSCGAHIPSPRSGGSPDIPSPIAVQQHNLLGQLHRLPAGAAAEVQCKSADVSPDQLPSPGPAQQDTYTSGHLRLDSSDPVDAAVLPDVLLQPGEIVPQVPELNLEQSPLLLNSDALKAAEEHCSTVNSEQGPDEEHIAPLSLFTESRQRRCSHCLSVATVPAALFSDASPEVAPPGSLHSSAGHGSESSDREDGVHHIRSSVGSRNTTLQQTASWQGAFDVPHLLHVQTNAPTSLVGLCTGHPGLDSASGGKDHDPAPGTNMQLLSAPQAGAVQGTGDSSCHDVYARCTKPQTAHKPRRYSYSFGAAHSCGVSSLGSVSTAEHRLMQTQSGPLGGITATEAAAVIAAAADAADFDVRSKTAERSSCRGCRSRRMSWDDRMLNQRQLELDSSLSSCWGLPLARSPNSSSDAGQVQDPSQGSVTLTAAEMPRSSNRQRRTRRHSWAGYLQRSPASGLGRAHCSRLLQSWTCPRAGHANTLLSMCRPTEAAGGCCLESTCLDPLEQQLCEESSHDTLLARTALSSMFVDSTILESALHFNKHADNAAPVGCLGKPPLNSCTNRSASSKLSASTRAAPDRRRRYSWCCAPSAEAELWGDTLHMESHSQLCLLADEAELSVALGSATVRRRQGQDEKSLWGCNRSSRSSQETVHSDAQLVKPADTRRLLQQRDSSSSTFARAGILEQGWSIGVPFPKQLSSGTLSAGTAGAQPPCTPLSASLNLTRVQGSLAGVSPRAAAAPGSSSVTQGQDCVPTSGSPRKHQHASVEHIRPDMLASTLPALAEEDSQAHGDRLGPMLHSTMLSLAAISSSEHSIPEQKQQQVLHSASIAGVPAGALIAAVPVTGSELACQACAPEHSTALTRLSAAPDPMIEEPVAGSSSLGPSTGLHTAGDIGCAAALGTRSNGPHVCGWSTSAAANELLLHKQHMGSIDSQGRAHLARSSAACQPSAAGIGDMKSTDPHGPVLLGDSSSRSSDCKDVASEEALPANSRRATIVLGMPCKQLAGVSQRRLSYDRSIGTYKLVQHSGCLQDLFFPARHLSQVEQEAAVGVVCQHARDTAHSVERSDPFPPQSSVIEAAGGDASSLAASHPPPSSVVVDDNLLQQQCQAQMQRLLGALARKGYGGLLDAEISPHGSSDRQAGPTVAVAPSHQASAAGTGTCVTSLCQQQQAAREGIQVRHFSAKVCDFGFSKCLRAGQSHCSTANTGTITHQAPEVLRHGHLSPAADVYALGIIMWELLTRDRPFKGLLEGDLVVGVCDRGLRPVFPPSSHPSYVALAQQCWAEDPAQRPTAVQVVGRLNKLLYEERRAQLHARARAAVAECSADAGTCRKRRHSMPIAGCTRQRRRSRRMSLFLLPLSRQPMVPEDAPFNDQLDNTHRLAPCSQICPHYAAHARTHTSLDQQQRQLSVVAAHDTSACTRHAANIGVSCTGSSDHHAGLITLGSSGSNAVASARGLLASSSTLGRPRGSCAPSSGGAAAASTAHADGACGESDSAEWFQTL